MSDDPGQKSILKKLKSKIFSKKKLNINLREILLNPEQNKALLQNLNMEELLLLKNALTLSDSKVDDIMIPRAQIEALDIDMTLSMALEAFENSGYSRMPVYSENLDDPKGMIHIYDILSYISNSLRENKKENIDLSTSISKLHLIRDVLYVPGSMLASKLLQKMQTSRTQMALVIDEYGGTDGLVSLEDIVEILVGDIEDEHDKEETAAIVKLPNGGLLVDATTELTELKEVLGENFNYEEDEVDTIGGLIITSIGYIPSRGETIEIIPGYLCRILNSDRRRIKTLRIKPIDENNNRKQA